MLNVLDIERLVEEYGTLIYGFCYKLTGNKEDCEDLYQQTFLKAMEMLERIDCDNNPKSFLAGLALGISKNNTKKYANRQRILPTISLEETTLPLYQREVDTERNAIDHLCAAFVNEVIKGLKDKLRIPVIMYYYMELSVEEIGNLLSIPSGTVKSRLSKARTVIKKELEAKGYE